VLLSGAGRTLTYLLDAIERGELHASVEVVISSRPDVLGIDVATRAGLPLHVVQRSAYSSLEAYSEAMEEILTAHNVELIIMAGFLRKMRISPEWEGRVLNIHPCLLPEAGAYAAGKGMYGERVHAAVLAHGDTVSGATVHIVTADYDEGPPLARVEVPVLPGDTPETLGTRVFEAEKSLYPATIRDYLATTVLPRAGAVRNSRR
jgi:formyltetrahydrofolate-dependent phosphoribosylglycinamide formyltransferase